MSDRKMKKGQISKPLALTGLDIHNTDELQPELQDPQVGEIIPFW
jgi:hypothetical protein